MDPQQKTEERGDVFAGFCSTFKSFATEAIHVGQEPEQWKSMAVVPPISLSTTFKQHGPGNHALASFTQTTNYNNHVFKAAQTPFIAVGSSHQE